MKTTSIAQKIGFWLVLVTFVVTVVFGVINYFLFVNQLDKNLEARLDESTSRVVDLLALHVWNLDDKNIQEVTQEQAFLESFAQLRVLDSFGDVIYEAEQLKEEGTLIFTTRDIVYEEHVAGTIEAAFSTENIEVAKSAVIRSTLVIIFVVAFTVFVLAFFVARSISRPIVRLTETARDIASGNLKKRVTISSKDEIGTLAKTFNFMTRKLQKSQDQLKQQIIELKELDRLKDNFLNNTTHELKTPLIPIKSQAQMLLDAYYGKLNKDQKQAVEMILRNEEHLSGLVADVMNISKVRSKKMKFMFKKADLKTIIEKSINDTKSSRSKGFVI